MIQKKCATCKQIRDTTEFFKCKQQNDGFATICKDCERVYRRARYKRNKYDQEHETRTEAVCSKCQQTLPISMFIKTPALKGGRQHHCSVCEGIHIKRYFSDVHKRNMRTINMLRAKSIRDNLPFDLTADDITIPNICPVLGIPLSLKPEHRDNYPSIDRMIPELGYVKGNITVISYRANRIKNDATLDELKRIVQYCDLLTAQRRCGIMAPPTDE